MKLPGTIEINRLFSGGGTKINVRAGPHDGARFLPTPGLRIQSGGQNLSLLISDIRRDSGYKPLLLFLFSCGFFLFCNAFCLCFFSHNFFSMG